MTRRLANRQSYCSTEYVLRIRIRIRDRKKSVSPRGGVCTWERTQSPSSLHMSERPRASGTLSVSCTLLQQSAPWTVDAVRNVLHARGPRVP